MSGPSMQESFPWTNGPRQAPSCFAGNHLAKLKRPRPVWSLGGPGSHALLSQPPTIRQRSTGGVAFSSAAAASPLVKHT
eukprot:6482991-Amphidinium_carterae.1